MEKNKDTSEEESNGSGSLFNKNTRTDTRNGTEGELIGGYEGGRWGSGRVGGRRWGCEGGGKGGSWFEEKGLRFTTKGIKVKCGSSGKRFDSERQ